MMKQATKTLVLLTGIILSATAASTIFLLYSWNLRAALDKKITENSNEMLAATELDIGLQRQKGIVASYLMDAGNKEWLQQLALLKNEFRLDIQEVFNDFRTETERSMITEIKEAFENYDKTRDDVITLYDLGQREEAITLFLNKLNNLYLRVANRTNEVVMLNKKELEEVLSGSQKIAQHLTWIVAASGALTTALGITLIWVLIFRFYHPLRQLTTTAEQIAGAGKGTYLDGKDDIDALGYYLSVLISKLSDTRFSLEASQKNLEHSERLAAIGNAVAKLMHDIRNRIAVIGLLTSNVHKILEKEGHTIEQTSIIIDEIRKLERMLHDIRDFSKHVTYKMELTDLNSLIRKTIDRLSPEMLSNVLIRVKLNPEISKISIDCERIEQVLMNLVNNSVEAMNANGNISIITENDNNYGVVMIVEDNGPGIPEVTREKLFEPFFTTKKTGNGLGLTICEQIIQEHGGSIELDTNMTRGAKFVIKFPSATSYDS